MRKFLALLLSITLVVTSMTYLEPTLKAEAEPASDSIEEVATLLTADVENGDGVKVILTADKGVFPEGCELQAKLINNARVDRAVSRAEDKENVAKRSIYDITVTKDGQEIQPDNTKGECKIVFALDDMPSGADGINVFHTSDGSTEEVKSSIITSKYEKVLSDEAADAAKNADASELVVADAESFSYYTVDFTYEDKSFSVPGSPEGTSLAKIISKLGITEDITDVEVFDDADCTTRAKNSAVVDENGKVKFRIYEEDGEWYISSEVSFTTTHGIIVHTTNGEYKIEVSDAAVSVWVRNPNAPSRNSNVQKDNYFRKSELLEVVPEGFSSVSNIEYSTSNTHPSGSGNVYFAYFSTRNMYEDKGTWMYTTTPSYKETMKQRWFALIDNNVSYPQYAKITITVTGKDSSGANASASITLTGFLAANLEADMEASILCLFVGEEVKAHELYGLSGVTHIQCDNSFTDSASVADSTIASVSTSKYWKDSVQYTRYNIKGLAVGKTTAHVKVHKNNSCDHHKSQTGETDSPLYVIDKPVDNGDGTASVNTPSNGKITYIIEGDESTPRVADNVAKISFPVTKTGTVNFTARIEENNNVIERTGSFTMSEPKKHAIECVAKPTGKGTVTVTDAKEEYVVGKTITISATPGSSYVLEGVSVATSGGTAVAYDAASNSFTMPDDKAIVTATFTTLVKPTNLAYDGTDKKAKLKIGDADASDSSDIKYEKKNSSGVYVEMTSGYPRDAGDYKASYTKNGKTITVEFTITPKTLSASNVKDITAVPYIGAAQTPAISFVDGEGKALALTSDDYSVAYSDNINAGTNTASATVMFKGNYTGSAVKKFTINKAQIKVDNIKANNKKYDGKTDATLNYASVTLTADGYSTQPSDIGTLTVTAKGTFENADASTSAKTVNLTELELQNGNGNYVLASSGQQTTTTAFILAQPSGDDAEDEGVGGKKARITAPGAQTYTGKVINISDLTIVGIDAAGGEHSLVKGTDYTLSYETDANHDNLNVGVKKGIVHVHFKGNYSGDAEVEFDIVQKEVGDDADEDKQAVVADIPDQKYTGAAVTPALTITDPEREAGSNALVKDKDYTVTFKTNINAGTNTAIAEITYIGNYKGTTTKTFTITPAKIKVSGITALDKKYDASTSATLNLATATLEAVGYLTDPADKSSLVISATGAFKTADAGTGKTVDIANLTLTNGNGNYELAAADQQQKTTTASILAQPSGDDAEDEGVGGKKAVIDPISAKTYTGSVINPTGLKIKGFDANNGEHYPLTEGDDYTLSYETDSTHDNLNVGVKKGIVHVHFKGNYSGDANVEFDIVQKEVGDDADEDKQAVVADIPDQKYTGAAVTPALTITDPEREAGSNALVKDVDYTVTFKTNINAGTNTAIAEITYIGNYKGSTTKTFTITPAKIKVSGITALDKKYDASTSATLNLATATLEAVGYLTDPADKSSLVISATGAFKDSAAGTGKTVDISDLTLTNGNGNYELAAADQQQKTTTASILAQPSGDDAEDEGVGGKKAKITAPGEQTYTGKVINIPDLTIVGIDAAGGEHSLEKGTDYTLSYEIDENHDNLNVGVKKGIVHVHFKGNYSGDAEVEFDIVQKEVGDEADKDKQANIASVGDKTYAGFAITPDLTITDPALPAGENTLVKGTDYTVEFVNNIEVGKASANITYKNNYKGSTSIDFNIIKREITVSNIAAFDKMYDGKNDAALNFLNMKLNGIADADKLIAGALTATAEGAFEDANAGKDKTVNLTKLSLDGSRVSNYKLAENGQQTTTTATIKPQPAGDDADEKGGKKATVDPVSAKSYTGDEILPNGTAVVVKSTDADGNPITLVEGTDYDLAYKDDTHNNKDAGAKSGIIYIKYKNNYSGDTSVEFDINRDEILVSGITGVDKVYDGTKKVNLNLTGLTLTGIKAEDEGKLSVSVDGLFKSADVGTDKTINLSNLVLVGDAASKYQLKAEGQQTTATANITRRPVGDDAEEKGSKKADVAPIDDQTYTGKIIKPANGDVVITYVNGDGQTVSLEEGTDYKLTYTDDTHNNIDAGNKSGIVNIEYIGNFSGETSVEFNITPQPAGDDADEQAGGKEAKIKDITPQSYTGTEIKPSGDKLVVTTTDADGKTINLTEGNPGDKNCDYYLTYTDDTHNNIDVGSKTGIVYVNFVNNYSGQSKKEFDITEYEIIVSGITAKNKVYDGTDSAELVLDSVVLDGLKAADIGKVSITVSGKFDSADAGAGKTVKLSDLALSGDRAKSYVLADADLQQKTATADITRKPVGDDAEEKDSKKATVGPVSDKTYTGKIIEPKGDDIVITYVDDKGNIVTLEEGTDYKLTYADDTHNNIDAGNKTGIVNIEYIGNYEGTTSVEFNILPKELGDDEPTEENRAKVDPIDDQTYSGEELKPALTITDPALPEGEDLLEEGKDYELSYENNVNIGEATVTITYKGNYKGSTSITFKIVPVKIVVSGITGVDKVYDGTTAASLNLDGLVLDGIRDADEGKLSVSVSGAFEDPNAGKDKTIKLSGLALTGDVAANYQLKEKGQQTSASANITRKSVGDDAALNKATVAPISDQAYTGDEICPDGDKVQISYTDKNGTLVKLVEGKDYKLTYTDDAHNNIDAGIKSGIVNIEYIGNYEGTTSAEFNILPKEVGDEEPSEKLRAKVDPIDDQIYSGEEIKSALTITDPALPEGADPLKEGKDYELSFENNVNVGEATVNITYKGNYSGTTSITFKIVPIEIVVSGITGVDKVYDGTTAASLNLDGLVLDGIRAADKGKLSVSVSGAFEDPNAGKDKTIKLSGLSLTGDAVANYQLKDKGQQTTATANITGKPVGDEAEVLGGKKAVVDPLPDKTYTGKIIEPKGDDIVITYVDDEGNIVALEEGKDYNLSYTDVVHNNTDAGIKSGVVNIEYIGNFSGTTSEEFNIVPKNVGDDAEDGDKAGVEPLSPEGYTGFVIEPNGEKIVVKVKDEDGKEIILEEGKDYELDYTDETHNNIDAGVESGLVYIKFEGNYTGVIVAYFDIDPKAVGEDQPLERRAVIEPISEQKYTGQQITPKPVVKDAESGEILVEGRDYTLEYGKNIGPGEGFVKVKFMGNYSGVSNVKFVISKTAEKEHKSRKARTGDTNNLILFAGIGGAAIIGAAYIVMRRRKEEE